MTTQGRQQASGRWRLSLRTRLIALVLAVAAAALIAVDVIIPLTTRSALVSTKDQTLAGVMNTLPPSFKLSSLGDLTEQNPLAGEVGWSQVTAGGIAQVVVRPPGHRAANPLIGSDPAAGPFTVPDASGAGAGYRALAKQIKDLFTGRPAGYVVAWVPLDDVQSTINRLVLLEVLISLGLLVLLGAVAGLVIRRELRPLESMARTADDIAAGDLTRRVDPGASGTEVGRLGSAFNRMVDAVGGLLDERAASERRMRQFVADASHELRTPVAAIRGYTDLYRAGALPEEVALARAMDRMGFESRRMGALVDDLLTLTQTDAETEPHTGRVDLSALLTGVVDDAAVIDRARTWRLAGTATPAVVLGDRLRLHQLFANLLGNVRTHTPAGTTATVSVLIADAQVTVAVVDDGPGVAEEDLHRLFDRFFRADPSRSRERGGSGLGLSIAASIVRAHRGRITAGHAPGGGLAVTVVLPLAPAEEGPLPPAAQSSTMAATPIASSPTAPSSPAETSPTAPSLQSAPSLPTAPSSPAEMSPTAPSLPTASSPPAPSPPAPSPPADVDGGDAPRPPRLARDGSDAPVGLPNRAGPSR